jgi:hypothetical protein
MDWETNRKAIRELWPAAEWNDSERVLLHDELSSLDQECLATAIKDVKKTRWATKPELAWILDAYATAREAKKQEQKWTKPQPWQVARADTFACADCMDTGVVRVYANASVKALAEGKALRRPVDAKQFKPVMLSTRDAFPERGEDCRVHVAEDTKRCYWFALPRHKNGRPTGHPGVYVEMAGCCAKVAVAVCNCKRAEELYGKWDPEPTRFDESRFCRLPSHWYVPNAETADQDEARIREWLDSTGTVRAGTFSADEWTPAQF